MPLRLHMHWPQPIFIIIVLSILVVVHHFTGVKTKFASLQGYEDNETIVTTHNTIHPLKKEDTIIFKGKHKEPITHQSVLNVLSMKKNILSVVNAINMGH